jgi:hypothetical protein
VLLKAEMRNNLFVITQACKGNNNSKLAAVKVQEKALKVVVEGAPVSGAQTVGIAFQDVATRIQVEVEAQSFTEDEEAVQAFVEVEHE